MSSCRSPRESPEHGSSSIIICGSAASATASATWRCSPCESEPTISESLWSIATRRAASRARSRILGVALEPTGRRCPPLTPTIER